MESTDENGPTHGIDVADTDASHGDCGLGRMGVAHLWRSYQLGRDTFVAPGRYRPPRPVVGAPRVTL